MLSSIARVSFYYLSMVTAPNGSLEGDGVAANGKNPPGHDSTPTMQGLSIIGRVSTFVNWWYRGTF
jgi:hypothetical protein